MNDILVTVHVLTFKKFDNLFKNLDSVLSQTYNNIELIVSDDGSGNFPLKEVESFIKERKRENIKNVIILNNKENKGTVKHINFVLSKTNGELNVSLSQDDEFYSDDVIEKIVKRYKKRKFNVISLSRLVCKEGEPVFFYPHKLSVPLIKLFMRTPYGQHKFFLRSMWFDYASGSSFATQTKFLKDLGGYDERFVLWEDGPFIHRITKMGYKIDFGYDIIKIKYNLGGISNSGTNMKFSTDIKLYNNEDRFPEKDKYGWFNSLYLTRLKAKKDGESVQFPLIIKIVKSLYNRYNIFAKKIDSIYIRLFIKTITKP